MHIAMAQKPYHMHMCMVYTIRVQYGIRIWYRTAIWLVLVSDVSIHSS